MDKIKDIPVYQFIKKRALEDARQELLQEWREEGREKALQQRLEDLRRLLIRAVEKRWPELGSLVREQVVCIEDPKVLDDLTFNLIEAQTAEDARHALLNWQNPAQE
ncbi:MAG TPA: hypothetical protein VKR06_35210 [Ktedonosporobacter sp.]|nr:hypothetical protein [Ktedonosporobacter sp.]